MQVSDGDRAAAELQRNLAATLQRSLMPERLPMVPGLELAARYVPGEEGGVGGDWYDVFTLPSGWLCLVIGDVVGHGLRAAVVMGRLRSALRAYALDGGKPAEVLSKLDHKVQHFEAGAMATVLYAMFEPSLETLHVSSAGHPLPATVGPGDQSGLLDIPIDPPLGVRFGLRRRTSVVPVQQGSLLCFYTDGLIERRGRTMDEGMHQLCKALTPTTAEIACNTAMAVLVGDEPPEDDIAILTVRRQHNIDIPSLELELPAVPASLRQVRGAVNRWLFDAGAKPDDIDDMLLVVGEACSNVVEHAYGPSGGTIRVRMEYRSPDVYVVVSDTGRWRPARGKNRGRGTLLMERCSDELRVDHGPNGTEVFVRRRIGSGTE